MHFCLAVEVSCPEALRGWQSPQVSVCPTVPTNSGRCPAYKSIGEKLSIREERVRVSRHQETLTPLSRSLRTVAIVLSASNSIQLFRWKCKKRPILPIAPPKGRAHSPHSSPA
jgi:hypothetical protein